MAKNDQGPRPVPLPNNQTPRSATNGKSGETVTVACKLPNGIILRGFRESTRPVAVLGGGHRDERYFEEDGRRVTIYGNARPKGGDFRTRLVAGYALTQGVPKDLWDQWLAANKNQPMVRNGLVLAFKSVEEAAAEARKGAKIRSGLEPLMAQIENDPRVPKRNPMTPELGVLQMEDTKMRPEHFEPPVDEEAA